MLLFGVERKFGILGVNLGLARNNRKGAMPTRVGEELNLA